MFYITLDGVPEKVDCDQLWQEIKDYKVNFTVLEKKCYLYGEASNEVLSDILQKVERFGLDLEYKRG